MKNSSVICVLTINELKIYFFIIGIIKILTSSRPAIVNTLSMLIAACGSLVFPCVQVIPTISMGFVVGLDASYLSSNRIA